MHTALSFKALSLTCKVKFLKSMMVNFMGLTILQTNANEQTQFTEKN